MTHNCQLSIVTRNYLTEFYCILDTMIKDMTHVQLNDSISYNFIVQMIPHHEAAIKMSKNLLKYTTFVPLQNIALQIISEQTKGIENMKSIQCTCKEVLSSQQDLCIYQRKIQQIMQAMFTNMQTVRTSNNINANFIHEMIPHHRGAVEMSETALKYCTCPDLVPILKTIITSQEKGIVQMRHLLRCFGCCR